MFENKHQGSKYKKNFLICFNTIMCVFVLVQPYKFFVRLKKFFQFQSSKHFNLAGKPRPFFGGGGDGACN